MPDIQPYLDVGLLCCFWCGEDMGVTIDRRVKRGRPPIDAPKRFIAGYDPCDKCKKIFDKGIHVIGVTPDPVYENQEPMGMDGKTPMYPNGTWFMASEEWVTHFLADDQEAIDKVIEARKLLVPYEIVEKVVGAIKQEEAQDNESCPSGVPGDSGEVPDKED